MLGGAGIAGRLFQEQRSWEAPFLFLSNTCLPSINTQIPAGSSTTLPPTTQLANSMPHPFTLLWTHLPSQASLYQVPSCSRPTQTLLPLGIPSLGTTAAQCYSISGNIVWTRCKTKVAPNWPTTQRPHSANNR